MRANIENSGRQAVAGSRPYARPGNRRESWEGLGEILEFRSGQHCHTVECTAMATHRRPRASATPPPRSRLRPMRNSSTIRDFLLDQLAPVPGVTVRAMFGGLGFYAGEVFFGILAADRLFLKVDDSNRADYEAAGMPAFQPFADRPATMSYYEVPAAVLEDSDTLVAWARRSIRIAAARRR